MVRSRNHRRHDHGVDKAARDGTAGLLKDNSKRTCAAIAVRKARVVVGHVEADEQDRQQIKENDAPEDVAHDFGHVFGGVDGFAGCDGDGLSAAAIYKRLE